MSDKTNKKSKRLPFQERLEKLGLTTLQERKGDLIENFKLINAISMVDIFFNISPQIRNLLSRQISKIKYTNQLWFEFQGLLILFVVTVQRQEDNKRDEQILHFTPNPKARENRL